MKFPNPDTFKENDNNPNIPKYIACIIFSKATNKSLKYAMETYEYNFSNQKEISPFDLGRLISCFYSEYILPR